VCKSFDLFTVQVFSDNQNDMSFEDFLDMASVFSEGATRDVKSSYAFRMYDFDDDGYLGEDDLRATVRFLIGAEKSPTEKNHLTDEQINEVRFPPTAHTVHTCSLHTVGDLQFAHGWRLAFFRADRCDLRESKGRATIFCFFAPMGLFACKRRWRMRCPLFPWEQAHSPMMSPYL
jgi:hypothetical protein